LHCLGRMGTRLSIITRPAPPGAGLEQWPVSPYPYAGCLGNFNILGRKATKMITVCSVWASPLLTITLRSILLTVITDGSTELSRTLHARDKDTAIACYGIYDADLILSTLAGSAWIGIRLADISSQNVSCEAQEPPSKAQASLVMWHERTHDTLGGVRGAGLPWSDDVDEAIEMC
jgi:hypothetical protein